mgnify:CR=1 FL=1
MTSASPDPHQTTCAMLVVAGWGTPASQRDCINLNVRWMKRNSHFQVGATVYNPVKKPAGGLDPGNQPTFLEHPWALRITGHTAQVACQMWEARKELKKTRGQAGWGVLYLLQRLSAEGVPEPHYKASADVACCRMKRYPDSWRHTRA